MEKYAKLTKIRLMERHFNEVPQKLDGRRLFDGIQRREKAAK